MSLNAELKKIPARVNRLLKLTAEKAPNFDWKTAVQKEEFNMSKGCNCFAGELGGGNYKNGCSILGIKIPDSDFGIESNDEQVSYALHMPSKFMNNISKAEKYFQAVHVELKKRAEAA